jgi:hypothetical protein
VQVAKAIDALNEALHCLERSDAVGKSASLSPLERKIQLLGSFCNANRLAETDEKAALQICGELLKDKSINVSPCAFAVINSHKEYRMWLKSGTYSLS